ncbi:MAG: radical SAM protein [Pseudomonadota bacterium]|nr:radical SAM protein [Pseudomonadota bacterium]
MDVLGFEKILFHPEKLEKLKAGETQFPINATISLGNYCNHGCLWCTVYAARQEDVRHMDEEQLISFLSKSVDAGLKSVAYIGNGEPTAYPGFGKLVDAIAGLGLEQGMFTNGYLLDRHIDQILRSFTYVRVSLDAGSAEVHDAMHDVNGHYDRIIDNILKLGSGREGLFPAIGVQYAVHHENLDDLYRGAKAARDAGADYFSIKPVYNRGSVGLKVAKNNLTDEDLAPVVHEVRKDLENREFKVYFRPHQIANEMADENLLSYDKCVAGFFNMQIYEDGSVVSCGPGHVQTGTIHDVPESLVENILNVTKTLDLTKCPAGCRYHPLNHLVASVLDEEVARQYHPNFI